MKTILTVLFLSLNIAVFSVGDVLAQTKTFSWENPACAMEGKYDSQKYTEKQLKDTWELVSSTGAIPLFTQTSVFKYEDIGKLSVEDLDTEYRTVSNKVKNLEVVKDPYWQRLKKAKIRETDEFYKLKRLSMQSYKTPSVLRKYEGASFCKDFYVEPLVKGGEYLRATWLKVNMDSRQQNSGPGRMKRKFDMENARRDWEKFARVEVMNFGWGNCANKTIPYVENDGSAEMRFRKLFISVKEECDEP
ncbi:MAG: hypothetical protein HKN25_14400 [Pyrinomonadaceae bacterium]|nr:hypothetical protein [Pyrinomonadaceae bacterium]